MRTAPIAVVTLGALAFVIPTAAHSQSAAITPTTIVVPSGPLQLGSSELQRRLRASAGNINVPVFLTHAENDYSTKPAHAMAKERSRLKKPYELKIYRGVGSTAAEGHDAVYNDIPSWESDVFRFLGEHLR